MLNIWKIFVIVNFYSIVNVQSSSIWYDDDDDNNFDNNWIQLTNNNNNDYDGYDTFYISNDQNYLECEDILRNFEKGKLHFDKIFSASDQLINDGFLQTLEEPFSVLFFGMNFQPFKRTKDFIPSLRTLSGIKYALDVEKKKYLGKSGPSRSQIRNIIQNLSVCIPKKDRCSVDSGIICDPNERYRSFDGSCNNLAQPLKGAAFTPYSRLTEAFYDDNIMEIRKNWKGTELTSPRRISDKIFSKPLLTKLNEDFIPNMGFSMFGQLLAHDVAGQTNIHHILYNGIENGTRCCSADYKNILPKLESHFSCLPFQIAPDDKFFGQFHLGCHNFIRSQPGFRTDCKLSSAEQVNIATGYIDLSIIYGVNVANDDLRVHIGGLLKTNENNALPMKENCYDGACYFTGDFRVNQTPSLALTHSLFIRLHNLIATTLRNINPLWDDERIFQEARRINIAIMQHIVFEEYLPILIDERLTCNGLSSGYNPTVDGTTTNDFTTSIFRHLHAFCTKNFELYNEAGQITTVFRLSEILDNTTSLEYLYNDIARGLIYQPITLMGYDDEIRNRVFKGMDLLSIDIQRGRDHGLAPYWKYREMCGFGQINSFDDLLPIMSKKNIELLQSLYSSPKDIDILVGGALEEKGLSLLGPTFKCIAKTQFLRYKHGDRFFYTHQNGPYPFTTYQLAEIKNFSFSKLLCAVTDIKKVPLQGLFKPSKRNILIHCNSLRTLDLIAWKE